MKHNFRGQYFFLNLTYEAKSTPVKLDMAKYASSSSEKLRVTYHNKRNWGLISFFMLFCGEEKRDTLTHKEIEDFKY